MNRALQVVLAPPPDFTFCRPGSDPIRSDPIRSGTYSKGVRREIKPLSAYLLLQLKEITEMRETGKDRDRVIKMAIV